MPIKRGEKVILFGAKKESEVIKCFALVRNHPTVIMKDLTSSRIYYHLILNHLTKNFIVSCSIAILFCFKASDKDTKLETNVKIILNFLTHLPLKLSVEPLKFAGCAHIRYKILQQIVL